MSLLNDIFLDDIKITKVNKKYMIIVLIMVIIEILLLIIKKDNYYQNIFNTTNEEIVLLVQKEYITVIQDNKTIFINDIKCDYSIKEITIVGDLYLVSINTKPIIKNTNQGNYKVYLGKERLFDYIVRIIKN